MRGASSDGERTVEEREFSPLLFLNDWAFVHLGAVWRCQDKLLNGDKSFVDMFNVG